MGIKIKNLQTGEFEKFNIPALKGEKGEPGEIEPSEKVDYIGKQHSKLRDTMNANVDYIIKTAIGEFNYLDYEGQHIAATNSIEGHAKSAILSGSTKYQIGEFIQDVCVPVQKFKTGYYLNWETGVLTSGEDNHKYCEDYIPLPTGVTSITSKGSSNWKKLCCYDSNKNFISGANGAVGLEDLTLNIPSNAKYFRYSTNTSQGKNEYINVVSNTGLLLASSNYNIPCELISCKMPVLTTTGKNLFDISKVIKNSNFSTNGNTIVYTATSGVANVSIFTGKAAIATSLGDFEGIKVSPNTKYTLTNESNANFRIVFNDITKNINNVTQGDGYLFVNNSETKTFTTPSWCEYIDIKFGGGAVGEYIISNLQLEQGSTATSYEPFKSNILTVNEPVELRGIGGVKDELNLLTGELTERIGEIVLDENATFGSNGFNDEYYNIDINPTLNGGEYAETASKPIADFEHPYIKLTNYTSRFLKLRIYFNNDFPYGSTHENATAYLRKEFANKPMRIQYQLGQQSIKTVVLSDDMVYSYDEVTHYDCSSEEGSLVPTIAVKVPTDTQLTIQEQKATTQTLLIKNMDLQQSIKEVQAMNLAFNTALYNSFNSIREEVEDIKKHISTNENLEGSF